MKPFLWLETLAVETRFALRGMQKGRIFTLVAVLTFALGIGANTAIFSVMDAMFLNPLPDVQSPSSLVGVFTSSSAAFAYGEFSYPDYRDLKQGVSEAKVAGYWTSSYELRTEQFREAVSASVVTPEYFQVLGLKAGIGRLLTSDDDTTSGTPAVVVSSRLWQRMFNASPDIVGTTIFLNNQAFTVAGVASERFRGLRLRALTDLWVPFSPSLPLLAPNRIPQFEQREARWLSVIARLNEGVALSQFDAQARGIAARLAQSYPQSNGGTAESNGKPRLMTAIPIEDAVMGFDSTMQQSTTRLSLILISIVTIVLLIACSNVANLLLTRAHEKRKDIATRLALGAGSSRVVAGCLIESVAISVAGGALGLVLAVWLGPIILSFDVLASLSNVTLSLNTNILLFTFLVSSACGVVFGIVPAFAASRLDPLAALKGSSGGFRLRKISAVNVLVIAQLSLSMVLLIAAGLFVGNLVATYKIERGFSLDRGLIVSLNLRGTSHTEASGRAFYAALRDRLRQLPGSNAVAIATSIPLSGRGSRNVIEVEGYSPAAGEPMETDFNVVDENYFGVMGIELVAGRSFATIDSPAARGVILVNEQMARRFWPGQDPIGKRIFSGPSDRRLPYEVVGVVKDGKYRNVHEDTLSSFYLSFNQNYRTPAFLVARTSGAGAALASTIPGIVAGTDPRIGAIEVRTIEAHLANVYASERASTLLVASFGLLAMLVAAVGTYGVMRYLVQQRMREMGIRIAVGASSRDVMRLVFGHATALALIGVFLGVGVALPLTRWLAGYLVEIHPNSFSVLFSCAVIQILVVLFSCFVPARRASRADPLAALRAE